MEVQADDVRAVGDETAGIGGHTRNHVTRHSHVNTMLNITIHCHYLTPQPPPNHHRYPPEVRLYTYLSSLGIIVVIVFAVVLYVAPEYHNMYNTATTTNPQSSLHHISHIA